MANDYFAFKRFTVRQPRSAMRVGTDGVLLGAWCDSAPAGGRMLDVGTGTGVIALILAQRNPSARIDAVEIDEGSQYTYVIYGITKKKAPEIRARLMAGETIGVHAKVIDRPGYKMLTFELD